MALSNVCLFLGEEKYIINSKINRIIKETKADEFNITSYDCEETNVSNAIQDALTPPFMSDTKVVLIKKPLFLTNEKSPISHDLKLLNSYIESPLETTYLIIDASLLKLNEKNETVKLLRKKAFVSETKAIGDIEFTGWLKRQCDLENVSIKDDAIKLFVNLVGKDLINAKTEVDKLKIAMLLYDIGNTMMPKDIMKKAAPLNNKEKEAIQKHPVVGAREILQPIDSVSNIIPIIEDHHENWDGSGYPNQKKGDEIPVTSQIILIVDAYFALTEHRPYRAKLSPLEALIEIKKETGKKWSEALVQEFVTLIEHDIK